NLAPHQLRHSDIGAIIGRVLKDSGFPPDRLELELTESALMMREGEAEAILHRLRALGIRLAIDDFGTGYSSLAYLKRFPLDVLKIDKRFIDDIPHHQDDKEIAAAIIAMAHTLGLKVIAEGVETPEQFAFLKAHHCDRYQGFLTSPAIPADKFELLVSAVNSQRQSLAG
ncbi:MAG: EAL domain-containing protein, partial [Gammaproteobacteria bacterium]|nr:EAL domain-containing protein [Gammaproteobacteria bacterium]